MEIGFEMNYLVKLSSTELGIVSKALRESKDPRANVLQLEVMESKLSNLRYIRQELEKLESNVKNGRD